MNIFRLAGDVSHLLAIIILLLKIWRSKSCAGRLTLISLHFNSLEAGGVVAYSLTMSMSICIAVVMYSEYSSESVLIDAVRRFLLILLHYAE